MRWALTTLGLICAAALALSYGANHRPKSAQEIALLTDRLMEFGAVDFVHSGYIGPQQALFSCVLAGRTLSPEQSRTYRIAYQAHLLDNQRLFARLDADLQLRRDAGMAQDNNLGGQGIAGLHDHHDASARANLEDINQSLTQLKTANFAARALLANDIYKDLTDLMVHMAPAVHSVGLIALDPMPKDLPPDLAAPALAFYGAMKDAQRADVNSAAYWRALDLAQTAYAALIEAVQSRIWAQSGPVVHTLSGTWLALQTVAPRLSAQSPSTKIRRGGGPCPIATP